MFTAIVTYKKVTGDISFNDGIITGDPMLVSYLIDEAEYLKGKAVGPYNYCPEGSHLSDPVSIRLLIEELFEDVSFIGDVPEDPELPEGANG